MLVLVTWSRGSESNEFFTHPVQHPTAVMFSCVIAEDNKGLVEVANMVGTVNVAGVLGTFPYTHPTGTTRSKITRKNGIDFTPE